MEGFALLLGVGVLTIALINYYSSDHGGRVNNTQPSSSSTSAQAYTERERNVPPPLTSSRPIEESLAIIDGVQFDAIKVNRFRSVLKQLASKYPENQQQIGDMTAKAYQILEGKGVSESLLNIMEGMNLVFPERSPIRGYNYSMTLSMYMALRDKGESHQNTLTTMADVLGNPNARQMLLDKMRNGR